MKPQYIKIQFGPWPGPVRIIAKVEARANPETLKTSGPDIADLLVQLREAASRIGANAVIHAAYELSISTQGWHTFAVGGTAVVTLLAERNGPKGNDRASRLEYVADLHDRGIITYEEYERWIARIRLETGDFSS